VDRILGKENLVIYPLRIP